MKKIINYLPILFSALVGWSVASYLIENEIDLVGATIFSVAFTVTWYLLDRYINKDDE